MIRQKIDIADEFVLLRKQNEKLRNRLDRIDVLFNQANNLITILNDELNEIKDFLEKAEKDVKNGQCL